MKYLKMYESFKGVNEKNAIEYFSDIVDLFKYKGYSISNLDIKENKLLFNNKEVLLDKYGNVKIKQNETIIKIIGRIKLQSGINSNGNLDNFSFDENVYKDGTPIKLGDDVIVDDEYNAVVDGFSDNNIIVLDQEDETAFVKSTQLKKDK